MNDVQVHLALTHVPVILSLVGLIMLIVAFFVKNTTVTKSSYILLIVGGIAALPVFFSGEGAEEAVENLPGVSEAVIERHEELAKLAMTFIVVAGIAALAALFSFKWKGFSRVLRVGVLSIAMISGGLMMRTAHLGGQIRHTEIGKGLVSLKGGDASHGQDGGEKQDKGQDD